MENLKGNIGEWSEAYTFLRLLADKKLYAADKDLNKKDDQFYPLLKIIRYERPDHSVEYILNEDGAHITIANKDHSDSEIVISLDSISKKSDELFIHLKNSSTPSFEIPDISDFLNTIDYTTLKSKSSKKSDISIQVHDLHTGIAPLLHFSIKSKLGNASTLFNSNKNSTNFEYEIYPPLNASNVYNVNSINTKSKIRDRISTIYSLGSNLNFNTVVDDVFNMNLQLIDSQMPLILGEIILGYFENKISNLNDLVSYVTDINPCSYNLKYNHKFYDYKIKKFLIDAALGMTSKMVWNGRYDATGGYIIVRSDGELVCYHIFNVNEFQDYLINNTYLDSPSTTRHDYAQIYERDGKQYIKLNLQIRFR